MFAIRWIDDGKTYWFTGFRNSNGKPETTWIADALSCALLFTYDEAAKDTLSVIRGTTGQTDVVPVRVLCAEGHDYAATVIWERSDNGQT